MPRGDGTGPLGIGPGFWGQREGSAVGGRGAGLRLGSGLARFGEPIPNAEELERQAAQLEKQAAVYRAIAETVKTVHKKGD